MPLADYLKADYLDRPLPGIDTHSGSDLRSQQLTDFINLQMVAILARLPEFNPGHVFLRFPRDLRFDDLKRANAIIIGSSCSNVPGLSSPDGTANFRIQCNPGMQGATVVNKKPQAGEAASYSSHWNEPIHETYSVMIFAPHLSGYGKHADVGRVRRGRHPGRGGSAHAVWRPLLPFSKMPGEAGWLLSPRSRCCCVRRASNPMQPTPQVIASRIH